MECSHMIQNMIGKYTKCAMCNSFLERVNGKSVVVEIQEETPESKRASEFTNALHKKLLEELGE